MFYSFCTPHALSGPVVGDPFLWKIGRVWPRFLRGDRIFCSLRSTGSSSRPPVIVSTCPTSTLPDIVRVLRLYGFFTTIPSKTGNRVPIRTKSNSYFLRNKTRSAIRSCPTTPPMDEDSTTEKTAPSHLSVKVVGQDGNEVFFKIKPSTKLGKLMKAWCSRQSVQESSVRFLFDGERVGPDATAEKLDMEDGDIIDAVLQQTGGGPDPRKLLAKTTVCYFCAQAMPDPKTIFMFRAENHAQLLAEQGVAPLHGAHLECATAHADRFKDVAGESVPHLKAE